jgi:hypothetical protein
MHYKTICLQMIQDRPQMYDQLISDRSLLTTLDRYAIQLRTSHQEWMDRLARAKPASEPNQIASEALEIAIEKLKDSLVSGSPPTDNDPLSLDGAMAFIRRHSPPA